MKTKVPMLAAIILNLFLCNYIISGSWGSFFSIGYFIFLHIAMSITVIALLWLMSRRFLSLKKTSQSYLFLLCVLTAYLPPVITIWLAFATPQLLTLTFDGLSTLLLAAFLTVAASFYYWVPLGIANYFLLKAYSVRVSSSINTTNN